MFQASKLLQPEFQVQSRQSLWQAIVQSYLVDEDQYLRQLLPLATPSANELQAVTDAAAALVQGVRSQEQAVHMLDSLLQEYSLDTQEGILLMCLAEALIRIPDAQTADALIRDKIAAADWESHRGKSSSLLVNASTWGLLMTGKLVGLDAPTQSLWQRLFGKCGEPLIRQAMNQAMKLMGNQFVLGRTIEEALHNGRKFREQGYTYSFDMLGEAALTVEDADQYLQDYLRAIAVVGEHVSRFDPLPPPTISIKLSALHPRYERSQQARVLTELYARVVRLIDTARPLGVGITVDAEEMDRLELSLKLFEKLYASGSCQGWGGFGLAVQAYSKRALPVLCWLTKLAREQGDMIPVRLVKGAYWDSEIKRAQQLGLAGYPVYTRKQATDVSFLACARYLLSDWTRGALYPQFATHNAQTVAQIRQWAEGSVRPFEFQRLHGMGGALYHLVLAEGRVPVRIYAPVGAHRELLPYLVRRLLENGANTSFVHHLVDPKRPVENLVQHPAIALQQHQQLANDRIPLPPELFGPGRTNSRGVNLAVESHLEQVWEALDPWWERQWKGAPIIAGRAEPNGDPVEILAPQNRSDIVGVQHWTTQEQARRALDIAHAAFVSWRLTPVAKRADCLQALADLLEANQAELVALCCREAGKTLQDSIDEIREAVDFCRYYADQARNLFVEACTLRGVTGEFNQIYWQGRGVFVCISPWNFPLAIFVGQIAAALAAGNTVLAKPAEQTSLIAGRAVELMLGAGIPEGVIQLLPGDGASLGTWLLSDSRVVGVAFTGSTETAHAINRQLAERRGAIPVLIAETGGQNAMIVDSTALPEQVVKDALQSAFTSAGQRCSALRVLYLQEDIAERVEHLLAGAMQELRVGDPAQLQTDVGPVIDANAQAALLAHLRNLEVLGRFIAQAPLSADCASGLFVAPTAYAIDTIARLEKEHFGPILHVVRFHADALDQVIDEINGTGYGLTLGVHSRNESTVAHIERRTAVGNTYVNRNQIGAVVGVQPFGGLGLSGTGPKAGGPHYLLRFAVERVKTINTTAVGGNTTLLSLSDNAERSGR